MTQDSTADCGLQVEPEQREDLRDCPAMGEDRFIPIFPPGTQRQQHGIVPESSGDLGLLRGLGRTAYSAGDPGERTGSGTELLGDGFGGQRQDRLEQPVPRVTDCELGGVDSDRHATSAGGEVVSRECPLPPFIELPIGREGERMGGNDLAGQQVSAKVGHPNA
jgi:hypothetical protein